MSNKLLNICFVAPLPPPYDGRKRHSCGGIVHWTRMICNYAKNRNDLQITVINTMPWWRSINNFSIWQRVFGGGFQFLLHIIRLCLLLSSQRIDIIHLTTSGQIAIIRDLGVLFVARMFRIPVIYHIRFGRIPEIIEAKNSEWRLMSRAIMKAHTVIAIDKVTKDKIVEYLPMANVVLIPNCINFSNLLTYASIPESLQKTVLFAGWVIPTKGVTELVEAWGKIRAKGWNLKIVGPFDMAYKKMLIERYQSDGIQFLGEMPHSKTIELIAACDIFVLPSYTEGFPNVILEAMALGKPILATDVGAIPEMLNGACGQLIKPKDVRSLKMALQLLIYDSDLRIRIGNCASKKALENYSIEVVFAKYMLIWRQATGH